MTLWVSLGSSAVTAPGFSCVSPGYRLAYLDPFVSDHAGKLGQPTLSLLVEGNKCQTVRARLGRRCQGLRPRHGRRQKMTRTWETSGDHAPRVPAT